MDSSDLCVQNRQGGGACTDQRQEQTHPPLPPLHIFQKSEKGNRKESCILLRPDEEASPFMPPFVGKTLQRIFGIQSFPRSAWFPEITGKESLARTPTTLVVAVDRRWR